MYPVRMATSEEVRLIILRDMCKRIFTDPYLNEYDSAALNEVIELVEFSIDINIDLLLSNVPDDLMSIYRNVTDTLNQLDTLVEKDGSK